MIVCTLSINHSLSLTLALSISFSWLQDFKVCSIHTLVINTFCTKVLRLILHLGGGFISQVYNAAKFPVVKKPADISPLYCMCHIEYSLSKSERIVKLPRILQGQYKRAMLSFFLLRMNKVYCAMCTVVFLYHFIHSVTIISTCVNNASLNKVYYEKWVVTSHLDPALLWKVVFSLCLFRFLYGR